MAGRRREPSAVKALIDAIVVRRQLKRMGVQQTGAAEIRAKDAGGTRKDGRHRKG